MGKAVTTALMRQNQLSDHDDIDRTDTDDINRFELLYYNQPQFLNNI